MTTHLREEDSCLAAPSSGPAHGGAAHRVAAAHAAGLARGGGTAVLASGPARRGSVSIDLHESSTLKLDKQPRINTVPHQGSTPLGSGVYCLPVRRVHLVERCVDHQDVRSKVFLLT